MTTLKLLKEFIDNIVLLSSKSKTINEQQKYGMFYLLESVKKLNENKIDDLKRKYPKLVDVITYYVDVNLPLKYLEWTVQNTGEYSLNTVAQLVKDFDELARRNKVQNKDIYSYKSIEELEEVVKEASTKLSGVEQRKQKKQNAKLIHKDGRFTIIQPLDERASCYYGYGTKWCISATQSQNYYDNYAGEGIEFIFIIDKQPIEKKYEKVAVAFHPEKPIAVELFDAEDSKLSLKTFMSLYPEHIYDVVSPYTDIKSMHGKAKAVLEQVQSMSPMQFKSFLYRMEREASDQNQPPNIMSILELIDEVPLKLLHVLYYPLGSNTSTLQNLGLIEPYVQRLLREHLTVDQFLDFVRTAWSLYAVKFDDLAYGGRHDAFGTYVRDKQDWSEEDMVKLIRFAPMPWQPDFKPFMSAIQDQLFKKKAQELGNPELEKLIRYYYLNDQFNSDVGRMVYRKRENPDFDVDDWWNGKYFDDYGDFSGKLIAQFVDAIIANKITVTMPGGEQF